ncbi:MAG: hypothetical protein A2Y04_00290 [Omnitrophica WOR_2 bacterium GWC2_45_7]|nr:MAG: hypothetical protein A2Z81_01040 [Omnitrophica WOR_2 bacterium GWA2_45_18]OGX19268.1 MAG: hypothetical protein A2Y04_00290 [Omnitrophica WOR_2 bacterium GWC2_45_7]
MLIVLWVLVVLTLLTVSLGRNTHIELSLTKYAVGQLKAKYVAWAGLSYAIHQIKLDSQDESSKMMDTLYHCGLRADRQKTPKELFQNRPLGGKGHFSIQYLQPSSDSREEIETTEMGETYEGNISQTVLYKEAAQMYFKVYDGFQDQERLINVNAITSQNRGVLSALIELLGFEESAAQTIAYSVVDWKDEDSALSHDSYGAEHDYYNGLTPSYQCKNHPFDSKEELLLVRGITKEIFRKIKHYVTIFPKEGNTLRINFDTSPEVVLKALARSASGSFTNTETGDADSLVDKILEYRRGDDALEFTGDDRPVELNLIPLNAKERVIFLNMNPYRTRVSNYLRVCVQGVEENSSSEFNLEAVIRRQDLAIVDWHTGQAAEAKE